MLMESGEFKDLVREAEKDGCGRTTSPFTKEILHIVCEYIIQRVSIEEEVEMLDIASGRGIDK